MKKKILGILLLGVLVVGLAGCGSKLVKTDIDDFDNGMNEEINNDTSNNSSEVVYKTYYCFWDDDNFYLYYENSELVKITMTSIYADNDDYKEAQESIKGINGLSVSRKNNMLYIDYDMKYVDEFADKQAFFDFSDTSYESMSKQLQKRGYTCTLTD